MKKGRYYSTRISTEVDIEVADIIQDVDTDVLIEELRRRKLACELLIQDEEATDNALFHYRTGNLGECLRYLERTLATPFRGLADKFFPIH